MEDKILSRLNEIIEKGKGIRDYNKYSRDDFSIWIRNVQLFIERVGSNRVIEETNKIINQRAMYVTFTGDDEDSLEKQTINHRAWQVQEILPILEALKEDLILFGTDEVKEEAKKIKKKFEIEGGIPGLLKAKWGVKNK